MYYNNGSSNNSKQIISNNSIKDNFRTPLTPLHRGGPRRLHKCRLKGIYSRDLEPLAFSLIELSIVLIIIGLIVAGVVGGKSLIESAKTRALMNEIRGYKQAVNTYYAATGRLPGDRNNTGIIDALGYAFEDLNNEGIMDCRDSEDIEYFNSCELSNIYKGLTYYYLSDTYQYEYDFCRLPVDLIGNFFGMRATTSNYKGGARVPVKAGKAIDEKMDDGVYDTGNILALNAEYDEDGNELECDLSYEDAMKKKNWYTDKMWFKLDIQP